MARRNRAEGHAGHQAGRCCLLHPEPVGLSDALHRRWQDADRQQHLGARHQSFATVRKSWLFSDTTDGAKASAVIYSLMLTCRACGVEPLTWLRYVLTELPQRAGDADIDTFVALQLHTDCYRLTRCRSRRQDDPKSPASMCGENRA